MFMVFQLFFANLQLIFNYAARILKKIFKAINSGSLKGVKAINAFKALKVAA